MSDSQIKPPQFGGFQRRKEGWLQLQHGIFRKKLRMYYFVLGNNSLVYFDDSQKAEKLCQFTSQNFMATALNKFAAGAIPLQGSVIIPSSNRDPNIRECGFGIKTKGATGRTYQLVTDTLTEAEQWKIFISKEIKEPFNMRLSVSPKMSDQLESVKGITVPNRFSEYLVMVRIRQGRYLNRDPSILGDPYVVIQCGNKANRTKVCKNAIDPKWDEFFEYKIAGDLPKELQLQVWNWDRLKKDDFLGFVKIDLHSLLKSKTKTIDDWIPLELVGDGRLHTRVHVEKLTDAFYSEVGESGHLLETSDEIDNLSAMASLESSGSNSPIEDSLSDLQPKNNNQNDAEKQFDENVANETMDRQSRTIAALGVDVMRNLSKLTVLIIGLKGVGVETAKNIILTGVKKVTLYDEEKVIMADLGSNFALHTEHIGRTRSSACLSSLAELNRSVDVTCYSGNLEESFIRSQGTVIITKNLPKYELLRINKICHSNLDSIGRACPIPFLLALNNGPAGHIYTDFGQTHEVHDSDGEPTRTFIITKISQDGYVTLTQPHGFEDGTEVRFTEVEGPTAYLLNQIKGIKIKREYNKVTMKNGNVRKVLSVDTFSIDFSAVAQNKRPMGAILWTKGGVITEVKQKSILHFRNLAEALIDPCLDLNSRSFGVFHPDQSKWMMGRGSQLHFAFLGALELHLKKGTFPRLHSTLDSAEVLEHCNKLLSEHRKRPSGYSLLVGCIDQEIIEKYCHYFHTEIPGLCAFLGGVIAQEVVKKFGKFTPIHQWVHLDYLDAVNIIPPLITDETVTCAITPPDKLIDDQSDIKAVTTSKEISLLLLNNRYAYQILCYGADIQNIISNMKWFLVGCGALGCEYLKGFALMGLGTGENGMVYVTDNDHIELSNLSRQFLFRNEHVGLSKSTCGVSASLVINPSLNIKAYELKVCPETENFFTDLFWKNLTGIWNALDNIEARKYVDSQCLLHTKPLFESGTQGAKANSEVILPSLTCSYSDHKDQDTGGIPACTLHNFPHHIDHCIEWSRQKFEEKFTMLPLDYNNFFQDKKTFIDLLLKNDFSTQLSTLKSLYRIYKESSNRTFESCVKFAIEDFNIKFRNPILDLIHYFPADATIKDPVTKEPMGPFWTGQRRFPKPVVFDHNSEVHAFYVYTTSNLYAFMLGVEQLQDFEQFRKKMADYNNNISLPDWSPPVSAINNLTEEDTQESAETTGSLISPHEQIELQELLSIFNSMDTESFKPLNSTKFEKDEDTNFHIDWVFASSNLRAYNYNIKPATRYQCKLVAGQIIPAMVTTTAMITGLLEMELYHYAMKKSIEFFRDSNVNLAVSTFNLFEPSPPMYFKERTEKQEDGTMLKIIPYPKPHCTWDHSIIDKGDLTLNEFIESLNSICPGIRVEALFKYYGGVNDSNLYSGSKKRSTMFQENMLKNPGLSDTLKITIKKQLEEIQEFNSKLTANLERKLIDIYTELNGPPNPERNFLLLSGIFKATKTIPSSDTEEEEEEIEAHLPAIKYIFRH